MTEPHLARKRNSKSRCVAGAIEYHEGMESVILEERVRKNLRRLESHGFKQHELANMAGISRVQVNRILNADGEPKLQTIERLAAKLGLDPLALLLSETEFEELLTHLSVTSA